jgi:hypothetical protein
LAENVRRDGDTWEWRCWHFVGDESSFSLGNDARDQATWTAVPVDRDQTRDKGELASEWAKSTGFKVVEIGLEDKENEDENERSCTQGLGEKEGARINAEALHDELEGRPIYSAMYLLGLVQKRNKWEAVTAKLESEHWVGVHAWYSNLVPNVRESNIKKS